MASFVERFGGWTPAQADAVERVLGLATEGSLTALRLMFVDQHGLMRGKLVVAGDLPRVFAHGLGAPSSLLLKDTSGRTVIPTFERGAGLGVAQMQGASDLIMVPDPTTFRQLPWAAGHGWMLCDIHYPDGEAIPFSTRGLLRQSLGKLRDRGFRLLAGAELEFCLFRPDTTEGDPRLHPGGQYLWDDRYDLLCDVHEALRQGLQGMGLPLGTIEVEFGPSQAEVTFAPEEGLAAADLVVYARSAIKQIARRQGLHATFMCRPKMTDGVASGWHLHQSLIDLDGRNAFVSGTDAWLSPVGQGYLGGLLAHARGATALAAPTVNGYRRYRAFSLAPDRVTWGRDNRAAMVRLAGEIGQSSLRLENRIGDPAANPYLYMASQILSGLDGLASDLAPGPASENPYAEDAERLPASLDDALDALNGDKVLCESLGSAFVDYWVRIKSAELARFHAEVTEWEHREYFELF